MDDLPPGLEYRHLTGRWYLIPPKSRPGRWVPIISELAILMRRYIEYRADVPNPYGLIFRHDDGSPITPDEDAQDWLDLLARAGLIRPEDARPGATRLIGHWTRHTVVTILAARGVPWDVIGDIVGQSSEQVTKIYRHRSVAARWMPCLGRSQARSRSRDTPDADYSIGV